MEMQKRIRAKLKGHAEVREAGEPYVRDRQVNGVSSMQRGYAEMGAINLGLATEAFQAENEVNRTTRHKASGV